MTDDKYSDDVGNNGETIDHFGFKINYRAVNSIVDLCKIRSITSLYFKYWELPRNPSLRLNFINHLTIQKITLDFSCITLNEIILD